MSASIQTAEEFDARRHELPDGGRWAELVRGVAATHQPPDSAQGTVVLNLSKALGEFAARRPTGYACYELGIVVDRAPDTVWYPAVAWFSDGPMFAEVDRTLAEATPSMVVEIPTTNDRRRGMNERVARWHANGVALVVVVDTQESAVHEIPRGGPLRKLTGDEILRAIPVLEDFAIPVRALFTEPDWWRKG